MAASVALHVYTSTNAATESASQTGISFLSIDSAATDGTTRTNNPVVAGTVSYTKHLRLKFGGTFTSCSNVKIWTPTSAQSNVALRVKVAQGTGGASPGTGGTTPYNTAMTGDADMYSYTSSGSAATWDSASYTTQNHVSKECQLQLSPNSSATPGAWTQHTIWYSYDEV